MPKPLTEAQYKKQLDELTKAYLGSYKKYAAALLKVQTESGKLVPMLLTDVQALLQRIMVDIRRRGLLIRIILLKARRVRASTWAQGRFFRHVTTKHNRHAVTITHEPEATDFLFGQIKRFHDHLPEEFKPATKYNNKKLLQFNTKDGKGLDSAFRVGTAGKGDYGSGSLTHYLLLSEAAKYPAYVMTDLLTSILQTVPAEPDTEVIFESTAKGAGGEFHDRFWAARYRYEIYIDETGEPAFKFSVNEKASADNIYISIFVPWFAFKKYREKASADFVKTDAHSSEELLNQYGNETVLAELYGLTNDQLQWRRSTIMNKCGGNLDLFNQEYPDCPESAFLTSGRPVFNNAKVQLLRKNAPVPIAKYEWLYEMNKDSR